MVAILSSSLYISGRCAQGVSVGSKYHLFLFLYEEDMYYNRHNIPNLRKVYELAIQIL